MTSCPEESKALVIRVIVGRRIQTGFLAVTTKAVANTFDTCRFCGVPPVVILAANKAFSIRLPEGPTLLAL